MPFEWDEVNDESDQRKVYKGCTEGPFTKCWYNYTSSFCLNKSSYKQTWWIICGNRRKNTANVPKVEHLSGEKCGRTSGSSCGLCQVMLAITTYKESPVLLNGGREINVNMYSRKFSVCTTPGEENNFYFHHTSTPS